MTSRTPGSSSAPPPPRRPGPGNDALSEYLEISSRDKLSRRTSRGDLPPSYEAVLEVLRSMEGQAPVEELQRKSQLQFVDFTTTLIQLENSGYISVSGHPGQEIVMLVIPDD